jgi:hypothetical protein
MSRSYTFGESIAAFTYKVPPIGRFTVKYKIGAAVCIAAMLAVIPVYAHHPFSAEYDSNNPVTVMGTVTKIDWENPHAHLYVDVKGNNGETEHWTMELGNPNKLTNNGWKKDTVKLGDMVTINGWKARDGSNRANVNTVTMPDGKKLAAGSSYFDGGKEKPTGN